MVGGTTFVGTPLWVYSFWSRTVVGDLRAPLSRDREGSSGSTRRFTLVSETTVELSEEYSVSLVDPLRV